MKSRWWTYWTGIHEQWDICWKAALRLVKLHVLVPFSLMYHPYKRWMTNWFQKPAICFQLPKPLNSNPLTFFILISAREAPRRQKMKANMATCIIRGFTLANSSLEECKIHGSEDVWGACTLRFSQHKYAEKNASGKDGLSSTSF